MTPEELTAAEDLLHTLERLRAGLGAAAAEARWAGLDITQQELLDLRLTVTKIHVRTAAGLETV